MSKASWMSNFKAILMPNAYPWSIFIALEVVHIQSLIWRPRIKPLWWKEMFLAAMTARRSAKTLVMILKLKLAGAMGRKLSRVFALDTLGIKTTRFEFRFGRSHPEVKNWRTEWRYPHPPLPINIGKNNH